ncbi:hypothetical protein [Pseudovibrio denitrificans]|uniref:hypothetical protein n=1 Tax=Pseudovibrio denitrificans TaxID=258256 RepID=UPI0013E2DC5F|nr:hypothetical protein [Pseudovibrio denitrificans]
MTTVLHMTPLMISTMIPLVSVTLMEMGKMMSLPAESSHFPKQLTKAGQMRKENMSPILIMTAWQTLQE